MDTPMREDKAELELQEYLKGGPKAEVSMVQELKDEGQTAEEILEFLQCFA